MTSSVTKVTYLYFLESWYAIKGLLHEFLVNIVRHRLSFALPSLYSPTLMQQPYNTKRKEKYKKNVV